MPAGRPPKWTSPEEVWNLAESYFTEREAQGKPITITGLAYHLDTTRETLCSYQHKDEFTDTISKLKLRVERFAEDRLYEGAATGPIFALKNFGWKDTQTHAGDKENPIEVNNSLKEEDKELLNRFFKTYKPE